MSRLKRLHNIDALINALSIAMNQCSLSENDIVLINNALEKLESLKRKKGLTDKQFKYEVSDILEFLEKFFDLN